MENRLTAGQKMYSENELKDRFGMSRQTVRHAISVLEKEGLIYKVQGSGTYINDTRVASLKKRTRIAVVTTYVDGYIFPSTIQGIENILLEKGYSVQISFTNNQNSRERTILEDIISRDEVAGIIMETTKSGIPSPNLSLFRELKRRKIPIIFMNSYYPLLDIPHVSLNDKATGYKITKHLLDNGHRKIGGIFKLDDGQGHQRYAGHVRAMNEAGLSVDNSAILWVDTEDVKHLELSRDRILERFRDCTAMVCYNDEVAFGLIELFKKEGIRVPEDISVISVDDSNLAVIGDVKLTSVPHPMERLGEKAAVNLLAMIKKPGFNANYEFDTDIVQRESVRKIKGEKRPVK